MRLTIVDKLFTHTKSIPNDVAFRYLHDLDSVPEELTYKELWQQASAIADFLKVIAKPGSRIMLFFPAGMVYVKAFYGCLLAGMIAVPLYPPRRNVKSDRIVNVAKSCHAHIALTTQAMLAGIQSSWTEQNTTGMPLSFYTVDDIALRGSASGQCSDIDINSPAFLQYTSGSTGTPKGVIITHENIMANTAYLTLMADGKKDDVFVNWLPLFHDLGLITAVLWPIYLGASSVLMAPARFVRNPAMWLKAISHYRGSMCGAPNFAYDLCVNKIADTELLTLDLKSWRVAYNAAEPVKAETLNTFTERFSAHGFKGEAFYPGYGMAEATVFITGGDPARVPVQITVDRQTLAQHRLEVIDSDNPVVGVKLVACGKASPPHDVRVVNPDTSVELPDGSIGEIWFSGPSVSPGYWGLPELSKACFNQKILGQDSNSNNYLRTGDLGVIWHGDLFVTGRIKDLIILCGKNYYPQDIETSAVTAHSALRPGHCAAFENNSDQLIIVAEIEREYFRSVNPGEVIKAIRQQITHDHGLGITEVILLKPYKIPVTSSGKIQRAKTKQLFLDKGLDVIAHTGFGTTDNYVAPTSTLEHLLCDIWSSVLKLDRIGINDNFFNVGGNSLHAVEISAELQKAINIISIDAELLLEHSTIAQLAQFLEIMIVHAKNKQSSSIKSQLGTVII